VLGLAIPSVLDDKRANNHKSGDIMPGTYKVTEIVGTSTKSFAEAVQEGVKRASKTLRNLGWFQVVEERGLIKDGQVAEFQVTIKVGFKLED
jgi:flavin-binding protein dodecin